VVKSNAITITIADPAEWSQYVQELQKPFALRISTPQTKVKAGTKLLLDIDLTNGLPHEITIDNAITKYDVQVRDSAGNEAPLTQNGRELRKRLGQGGGRLFRVQPGDDVLGDIYVDSLMQPGTYTIQVSRTDEDNKVVVTSNTISVTVTP
jgi:hypothetical protein